MKTKTIHFLFCFCNFNTFIVIIMKGNQIEKNKKRYMNSKEYMVVFNSGIVGCCFYCKYCCMWRIIVKSGGKRQPPRCRQRQRRRGLAWSSRRRHCHQNFEVSLGLSSLLNLCNYRRHMYLIRERSCEGDRFFLDWSNRRRIHN